MFTPWKRESTTSANRPDGTGQSEATDTYTEIFKDLTGAERSIIGSLLKPKALQAGEVLFFKEAPIEELFFVTKGKLLVENDTQGFNPGDWITDIAFSEGEKHQFTLLASEPSALFSLSISKFQQLPSNLQHYFSHRFLELLKHRYTLSLTSTNETKSLNIRLKKALYDAQTRKSGEFVSSATAQQVLTKVPRLPVSSIQLLTKLLDPMSSQNEIVELIRQDPSLTSSLLRSINSSSYGFETKISDVQHAISLLGFDSVYQIVVSDSMRTSLPDTDFFRSNHTLSLEISHLAFVLAQMTQQGKATEMATLGLMSQIGEVVVELLKAQSPRLASLFGQVDEAAMGAELLRSWSLPNSIYEPLEYKRYPTFTGSEQLPEHVKKPVALLYLASVCHAIIHKHDILTITLFLDDYLSVLNIDTPSIEIFVHEKVIPALRRRKLSLPLTLRQLIGC